MENKLYERNILKQAFINPKARSLKISKTFFTDPIHQLIWNSYKYLGLNLSKQTMGDVFKQSKNLAHYAIFIEIISANYEDEEMWEYQYKYLYEEYVRKELINLSIYINTNIEKPANEIIKYSKEKLENLQGDNSINIQEGMGSVMLEIMQRKDGDIPSSIKSGYEMFDQIINLDFNRIVLIAAAKKIGKSKFIINLTINMLKNNPDIGIKFYSYELNYQEFIFEIIAMESGLTINQIRSKGYILLPEDMIKIEKVTKEIEKFDIEIETEPGTIDSIHDEFIKFSSIRKHSILVIDNIGLLKDKTKSQTETDDYIAKKIVEIKRKTKGLIFLVHHMTKKMEEEARIKDAYRPRLEFLRGSTRIQDYCNMVLLIHRPGEYEDIVKEEENKGNILTNGTTYRRADIIRKIFIVDIALNRNGNKTIFRFLHRLDRSQFKEWNFTKYE